MSGGRVVGWGTALPPKVVTNEALAEELDTSDDWIRARTGIGARRVGGTTGGLAAEAGRAALARAEVPGSDIDLLLLATCTPDAVMPATAVSVAAELDVTGGTVDVNAACSGYVYGLVLAHGALATGARRVLLIGSDTMSRITDWQDRSTAVLFADGAGAVVLERTDGQGELLAWDAGTDAGGRHLLTCALDGTIEMDGREVFRRAVRLGVVSCERMLAEAGVAADDVALLVPHQANARISTALAERVGISADRVAGGIERTGNTSAGSIPLSLAAALDDGRLARGDVVLYLGFGAGMSWAGALTRWGG